MTLMISPSLQRDSEAVSRAALSDLKAVEGVSEALAERIYGFFHENG